MSESYPASLTRERNALRTTVAVLSLVPISAGLAGILVGPRLVGGPDAAVDLSSHFAYLSGLLMAIGFLFLSTVPVIERRTRIFRVASSIVIVGGLARLLTLFLVGPPSLPHWFALVMELLVVPALAIWQRRVAQRCATARKAGRAAS